MDRLFNWVLDNFEGWLDTVIDIASFIIVVLALALLLLAVHCIINLP